MSPFINREVVLVVIHEIFENSDSFFQISSRVHCHCLEFPKLQKKGLVRSFDQKNLKRPTLILSLGGYIIFGTGLPSILWFVVVLNTISLSMWSKYPNSIRVKNHLELSEKILAVSKIFWLNTFNYPVLCSKKTSFWIWLCFQKT